MKLPPCLAACCFIAGSATAETVFIACRDDTIYQINEQEQSIRAFDETGQYFKGNLCSEEFKELDVECTFSDDVFSYAFTIESIRMTSSIFRRTGKLKITRFELGAPPDDWTYDCMQVDNPIPPGNSRKF